MEDFGDSREALFEEPNAYLQRYEHTCLTGEEKKPRQKIIFQEPYECMPNFHINNDFKSSPNHNKFSKDNCSCGKGDSCNCSIRNNSAGNRENDNRPMFDLKNLMPLLSSLAGGNGGGLNNIIKMLGSGSGEGGGLNNILKMLGGSGDNNGLTNILSNLTKGGGLGSLLNGLNISNLFNKKQSQKPEMKSTEFCIKDYTRVE